MPEGIEDYISISIHSTARVETLFPHFRITSIQYFNPLHREGGDSNTTQ